jgi:hypothetical protein
MSIGKTDLKKLCNNSLLANIYLSFKNCQNVHGAARQKKFIYKSFHYYLN